MSNGYRLRTGLMAELKKEHNLTEVELAHKLGCSRSTIHRIGSGDQPATLNFVFTIVAVFGLSIYDAVENAPYPSRHSVTT